MKCSRVQGHMPDVPAGGVEQENLLGAVGVGPEPVAWLYGQVCSARVTRGVQTTA